LALGERLRDRDEIGDKVVGMEQAPVVGKDAKAEKRDAGAGGVDDGPPLVQRQPQAGQVVNDSAAPGV